MLLWYVTSGKLFTITNNPRLIENIFHTYMLLFRIIIRNSYIGMEMGTTPYLLMIGHCVKESKSDWLGKASLHAGTGKPWNMFLCLLQTFPTLTSCLGSCYVNQAMFICGMLGEEGGGGGIWDSQKSCNDIKMHPLNFKRFLLLLSVHPSIIISVRMKVQNNLAWQLQAPDDGRSSRLYVALTSAEAAAWPRLHGPGRMCVSRTVVGGGWGLHRICLLRNGLHHTLRSTANSSRWGPSTMSIMTSASKSCIRSKSGGS